MIWPDFLHLALFAAIILHAVCDGAMDANAHLRIHLALHPLRDAWHLQKHCSRACLIAIGLLLPAAWDWDKWAAARIAELEQQLAAAQEREAAYAEYKRKLEAIVTWLEHHEPSVFARGLWDAINNPPEQEDTDENSSH